MLKQFEYDYVGDPVDFPSIVEMVPGARTGQVLIAVGLLLFLAAFVLIQTGRGRRLALFLGWFAPCIVALGMFVLSQRFIDELFINLKHPWNLYHHGRFSFSSQSMIDGTVEIFYYALLTPFAGSQQALVIANYALGMLIALGHVTVFWLLLEELPPLGRLFGVLFFALNGQILSVLSSGFGNGLVSLAFLLCILLQYRGRFRAALAVAALLPLVRIDAVVYGLTVLWSDWWLRRRLTAWPVLGLALSILAVLGGTRLLYGHWMLTPALFKSNLDVEYLRALNRAELLSIVRRLFAPFMLVWMVLLPCGLAFSGTDRLMKILKYYSLPAVVLLVLITSTNNSMSATWFSERYVLPSCVVLFVPAAWIVGRSIGQYATGSARRSLLVLPLVLLPLILSWRTGFVLVSQPSSLPFGRRIDYLSSGGIILDRVLPPDWTVAAHEVDSVGFYTERPILDLWGYTTRSIATSHTRNAVLVKSNCGYFQSIRPDVLWLATEDSSKLAAADSANFFVLANLDGKPPEDFFVDLNNIGYLCQAGDLVQLFNSYSPVVLRERDRVTVIFVRNDRLPALQEMLASHGYRLARERDISLEKLEEAYRARQSCACG